MPEDTAGDKTEDATPRRLEREREQGRTARSRDLPAAIVLLGAMLLLRYGSGIWFDEIRSGTERILLEEFGHRPIPSDNEITPLALGWMVWTARLILPFTGALLVIGVIACVMQSGLLFSWEPLMPDLNKLNPISGAAKLFSIRNVVMLGMNLLKIVIVLAITWWTLRIDLPGALALLDEAPGQMLHHSGMAIATLGLRLAILFLILGILDYGYQWYQFHEDLRMTKQEVKEEYKEVEGDPQIRGRRRQIQRQLAMQRMMQEVPKAEVVVRNPTHVAVAIRYTPEMASPVVVAKGLDRMAERILDLARQHGVPTWRSPALARSLYRQVEIGDPVPPELFPALAEILAHVLQGEKRAQYLRRTGQAAA